MFYFEPILPASWGRLSPLTLPTFKEWVLPGTTTSESYRVKLSKGIQKSSKATIATKKLKIAIFMPIEVFADFFHDEEVRTTPTMFICKSKRALDFLDDGWDKMQTGGVLLALQKQSVVCKLIISSMNFSCSFHYTRYHKVAGELTPLDMDLSSYREDVSVGLEVCYEGRLITILSTFCNASLAQIREDISYEKNLPLPKTYVFMLNNKRVC